MSKGTQDIIVDAIYNSVNCDYSWILDCRMIIESASFSSVQERLIPHDWKGMYAKESDPKLTCREFISNNIMNINGENAIVNQDKAWRTDESFALRTA